MPFNHSIYVAGHTGMIGSAVLRALESQGAPKVITRTHAVLELTDAAAVNQFFAQEKPDYVVLAAGRVGGIVENATYPADFITENLAIQLNVIRAAHHHGVKRLVMFGSSCMYPRECPQPMAEEALLTGKLEPTSMAYAAAKIAGVEMCLAFNRQYGVNRFLPLIPNSTYGPGDNFNEQSGHVLSVLLRRFHAAKLDGAPSVTLWGNGEPRREFVYADDVAHAVLKLLWMNEEPVQAQTWPMNIGVGSDVSIRELAQIIAKEVGYTGAIEWDVSKPNGAPQKLLDSSRMRQLGWQPHTLLKEGIHKAYEWYCQQLSTNKNDEAVGRAKEVKKAKASEEAL